MIVRTIAYKSDGTEGGVDYIETDLVKDQCLGIMSDGVISNPGEVFDMNKPVNKKYNFRIASADGQTAIVIGDLMISLEFIKY